MKKNAILLLFSIVTLFINPFSSYAEDNKFWLYFSNEDATDVVKMEKTINIKLDQKEALYSLLFYKLKEEPTAENLHPAVPSTIDLKDIVFDANGTLYLDFNDEIMNIGSRSTEFVFIKAVNSTYFTNFNNINHIYYTVNGTKITSLSHIDISGGFERETAK